MVFAAMIDSEYGVRRYIAEYSQGTEEQLMIYPLTVFDLAVFQKHFGILDTVNPMFDCHEIQQDDVIFLEPYIECMPEWDFINRSYFVEAHSV